MLKLVLLNMYYVYWIVDENIQFTFEPESKGTLPFLDVLLCRNRRELTATVYRKKTNNGIYLNWNAFVPVSWKRGTLRTLVQRAYLVCLTETYFLFKRSTYPSRGTANQWTGFYMITVSVMKGLIKSMKRNLKKILPNNLK